MLSSSLDKHGTANVPHTAYYVMMGAVGGDKGSANSQPLATINNYGSAGSHAEFCTMMISDKINSQVMDPLAQKLMPTFISDFGSFITIFMVPTQSCYWNSMTFQEPFEDWLSIQSWH